MSFVCDAMKERVNRLRIQKKFASAIVTEKTMHFLPNCANGDKRRENVTL